MSGSDQGDQDKSFLARWSQRKREAKRPDREAPVAEANVPPGPATEDDAAPEFDLSSLPKLEDVTETTDITAFLRKGVPEHLRNAALRKSWALDPAIRNYVNPALEYAYDWNTPGGVPGSGEIGAGTDVARLVSQIMGGGESTLETSIPVESAKEPASDAAPLHGPNATQKPEPDWPAEAGRSKDETCATAQEASDAEAARGGEAEKSRSIAPQQAVRRHGSAKPID
jgi:hypothetical protein